TLAALDLVVTVAAVEVIDAAVRVYGVVAGIPERHPAAIVGLADANVDIATAAPAGQLVAAHAAAQLVVAVAAVEHVVADAAPEEVVAGAAIDHVVAAPS